MVFIGNSASKGTEHSVACARTSARKTHFSQRVEILKLNLRIAVDGACVAYKRRDFVVCYSGALCGADGVAGAAAPIPPNIGGSGCLWYPDGT
jgi:hypothetical protein